MPALSVHTPRCTWYVTFRGRPNARYWNPVDHGRLAPLSRKRRSGYPEGDALESTRTASYLFDYISARYMRTRATVKKNASHLFVLIRNDATAQLAFDYIPLFPHSLADGNLPLSRA